MTQQVSEEKAREGKRRQEKAREQENNKNSIYINSDFITPVSETKINISFPNVQKFIDVRLIAN